jgi:NTP pyrophosphatase (non-canonical NTP hydrolase)
MLISVLYIKSIIGLNRMIAKETVQRIIEFRNDRDWSQFHTIKDLCLGLGIEVAELQEIFLWKNNQQIAEIVEKDTKKIADELADIFIFLTYISNDLGINLNTAVSNKIEQNNKKYPIEKAKGNNKKYDEL